MAQLNASNIKQYANAAALIAETIVPASNDICQLEDGSIYTWREGSTAVADGSYIIDQTSETANGRWIKLISAKSITSFSITLENCSAGSLSDKSDYTATGVLVSDFNLVAYTPPALGIIIMGVQVSANNQISVKYENQTGADLTGVVLQVRVIAL